MSSTATERPARTRRAASLASERRQEFVTAQSSPEQARASSEKPTTETAGADQVIKALGQTSVPSIQHWTRSRARERAEFTDRVELNLPDDEFTQSPDSEQDDQRIPSPDPDLTARNLAVLGSKFVDSPTSRMLKHRRTSKESVTYGSEAEPSVRSDEENQSLEEDLAHGRLNELELADLETEARETTHSLKEQIVRERKRALDAVAAQDRLRETLEEQKILREQLREALAITERAVREAAGFKEDEPTPKAKLRGRRSGSPSKPPKKSKEREPPKDRRSPPRGPPEERGSPSRRPPEDEPPRGGSPPPEDKGGDEPEDDDDPDDNDDEDDPDWGSEIGIPHERGRRNRAYNRASGGVKITTPKEFDGTGTKIAEWVFKMNLYFDATRIHPDDKVPAAAILLSGHAMTWWMALVREGKQPVNWNQFTEALFHQFQPIDENRKARDALSRLRQASSVQAYTADFTSLAFKIPDLEPLAKYYQYRAGLKDAVRNEMDKRDLRKGDLRQLQEQAQKFDEILFSQRTGTRPSGERRFTPKDTRTHRQIATVQNPSAIKDVVCFKCQQKGHYARECPKGTPRATRPKPGQKNRGPGRMTPFQARQFGNKPPVASINTISLRATVDPSIKEPNHATPGSAGIDLTPSRDGYMSPHQTVTIPTGLSVEIPEGHYGMIVARSGTALRGKILIQTGIVDSDYRGEIGIIATNRTPQPLIYRADGKAIAQMIVTPYETVKINKVKQLARTTRKGGFGSTDEPAINAVNRQAAKLSFEGKVGKQKANFLIDSGADGAGFIGEDLVERLKLKTKAIEDPYPVTVAGGQIYQITKTVPKLSYQIQSYQDTTDIHVIPANHEQIVLGNKWLEKFNPDINWQNGKFKSYKTNEFEFTS